MSLDKEIVVFDVDEVLFPLKAALLEAFNKKYRTALTLERYDLYSFSGWLFRDHRDLYDRLKSDGGKFPFFRWVAGHGYLTTTPPYEGVPEVLREIADSGRKIGIVSYRGTEEDPHKIYDNGPELTRNWLENHRMPFHYTRFSDRKAEALRRMEAEADRKVVLVAEDHPANTVQIVEAGYKVALVNRSYNQPGLLPKAEGDPDDYGAETFDQTAWTKVLSSGLVTRIRNLTEVRNLL